MTSSNTRFLAVAIAAVFILSTFVAAQSGAPAAAPTTSTRIEVKDLPLQKEMPDPLKMLDGSKVTTAAQWKLRREEMKKIIEDYEFGHMPPAPGNVKGTQTQSKLVMNDKVQFRMIHLTFGKDEKLGFDVAMFSPVETETVKAPFPTIISLTLSATENAGNQHRAALERGYAIAAIGYGQLGADNKNYRQTAFFPAYPEYDWNDFSAWAWGISRCVDYLQTDPLTDKSRIAATGASRLGHAVLLAGAFDERIALSAPVAAGTAFRFSGKDRGGKQGIDEIVDQNTYWFGPRFPEFKGQTDRLPSDQHWLLALTAPRPFIFCHALEDQYGSAHAALQSYLHAKPVYDLLGVPEKVGLNFRPGQHGFQAADWSSILDFADKHLRNMKVDRRFDTYPPAETLH